MSAGSNHQRQCEAYAGPEFVGGTDGSSRLRHATSIDLPVASVVYQRRLLASM